MQRATFLAASTAMAFAPATASGQTLTPVTVASAPVDGIIAALWAVESGAFRKAGLDVTVQKMNTGPVIAAAVVGGAINIGMSSLVPLLLGRAKGIPFVIVAPGGIYTAEAPSAGMVKAVNSPIKSGKDCNGQIMGVSGLNDLTALGTQAWVDATGGDSRTLRYLELPFSAVAEAVASGRIAAGTMPNPIFLEAIRSGRVSLLSYCISSISRRFMQAAFFANADYAAKNRETVTAFRRTVDEAGRYANEHHAEMIPLIAKFTGVDEQTVAALPQQTIATSLDVHLIQPLVDVAIKYKAVPPGFDTRTLIDPNAL